MSAVSTIKAAYYPLSRPGGCSALMPLGLSVLVSNGVETSRSCPLSLAALSSGFGLWFLFFRVGLHAGILKLFWVDFAELCLIVDGPEVHIQLVGLVVNRSSRDPMFDQSLESLDVPWYHRNRVEELLAHPLVYLGLVRLQLLQVFGGEPMMGDGLKSRSVIGEQADDVTVVA